MKVLKTFTDKSINNKLHGLKLVETTNCSDKTVVIDFGSGSKLQQDDITLEDDIKSNRHSISQVLKLIKQKSTKNSNKKKALDICENHHLKSKSKNNSNIRMKMVVPLTPNDDEYSHSHRDSQNNSHSDDNNNQYYHKGNHNREHYSNITTNNNNNDNANGLYSINDYSNSPEVQRKNLDEYITNFKTMNSINEFMSQNKNNNILSSHVKNYQHEKKPINNGIEQLKMNLSKTINGVLLDEKSTINESKLKILDDKDIDIDIPTIDKTMLCHTHSEKQFNIFELCKRNRLNNENHLDDNDHLKALFNIDKLDASLIKLEKAKSKTPNIINKDKDINKENTIMTNITHYSSYRKSREINKKILYRSYDGRGKKYIQMGDNHHHMHYSRKNLLGLNIGDEEEIEIDEGQKGKKDTKSNENKKNMLRESFLLQLKTGKMDQTRIISKKKKKEELIRCMDKREIDNNAIIDNLIPEDNEDDMSQDNIVNVVNSVENKNDNDLNRNNVEFDDEDIPDLCKRLNYEEERIIGSLKKESRQMKNDIDKRNIKKVGIGVIGVNKLNADLKHDAKIVNKNNIQKHASKKNSYEHKKSTLIKKSDNILLSSPSINRIDDEIMLLMSSPQNHNTIKPSTFKLADHNTIDILTSQIQHMQNSKSGFITPNERKSNHALSPYTISKSIINNNSVLCSPRHKTIEKIKNNSIKIRDLNQIRTVQQSLSPISSKEESRTKQRENEFTNQFTNLDKILGALKKNRDIEINQDNDIVNDQKCLFMIDSNHGNTTPSTSHSVTKTARNMTGK